MYEALFHCEIDHQVLMWALQVLLAIMSGVFGLAGWHFSTYYLKNRRAGPSPYVSFVQHLIPLLSMSDTACGIANHA